MDQSHARSRTRRTRTARAALVGVVLAASTVVAISGPAPAGAALDPDEVRLNQIQVVGSHNSYHLAASPEETSVRRGVIGDADEQMQYEHAPLPQQFGEQKIRQIELDVFRDDAGGKYANPLLRQFAGHGAHDPAMNQPGTKVLHIQDVDYRSTCLSLVACLEQIEGWSDANPNHLPIAILVELKDTPLSVNGIDFVLPDPWDAAAMDALDEEILGVVPRDGIITPDDVRGSAATLEEAVLSDGWPTLGESRGKLMFLMDNGGGYRTDYLAGHPSLTDRVLFTSASPGQADAAFVKMNEPRGNVERIQGLVRDGYVVRTRSDADTMEAREGDTSGRTSAFESGAQWVSTDYPVASYAKPYGTGFVVEIPGGTIARCNPINGPEGCVAATLEPHPETVNGAYVDWLYRLFLGRSSTNPDRWFWSQYLAGGGSRGALARQLARSAEAARGPALRSIFQAYLGRNPDAASRDYWAGRINSGVVLDNVEISVLASTEVYASGGGDPSGYVDRIFGLVLGRPADAASRDHYVARLEAGQTRSTIVRVILSSPEARSRRSATAVQVVLERPASGAERTWLADVYRTTRDSREVQYRLAATPEAYALATPS